MKNLKRAGFLENRFFAPFRMTHSAPDRVGCVLHFITQASMNDTLFLNAYLVRQPALVLEG